MKKKNDKINESHICVYYYGVYWALDISPSHTWLTTLIQFNTLKTEGKCNESVSNEFKIMRKSNSLHQIIRANK